MGLLNKILNEKNKEPVKDGLLKKAEHILSDDEKMFRLLLSKHNIFKASLLTLENNHYSIKYSFGLTEETTSLSDSTKDFWDGITFNTDFDNKSGEELYPFYQFFDEVDKNNLTSVYLCKLPSKDILFIPMYNERTLNETGELKQELINFLLNNNNDYKIRTALSYGNKALLLIISNNDDFTQYEIDAIKQTISTNDLIIQDEKILKLVLFTQTEIDIDLYKIQLIKTVKQIDDAINLESIELESAGYCSTLKGIKTFIFPEL